MDEHLPQSTSTSKNVSGLRQMLKFYSNLSICLKLLTFFEHLPTTGDIFFENVTSCRQMLAHTHSSLPWLLYFLFIFYIAF